MKHIKSDVFEKLKKSERAVANKFGHPIKIFCCDNGHEYINSSMLDYLKRLGIKLKTSAPYTAEQNGRTERSNVAVNRIVVDKQER